MTRRTGLSSAHTWTRSPEFSSDQSRPDWLAECASQHRFPFRPPKEKPVDYLRLAVGGNLVGFIPSRRKGRNGGGGDRGAITKFSAASRLRLLRFLNSVDRSAVDANRLWFLTLTYPGQWSGDPRTWKRDLDVFKRRMFRAWGQLPGIWKLEFQQRGAPHFHLILLVPPEMVEGLQVVGDTHRGGRRVTRWRGGQLQVFRSWCSENWYQVVGSGDSRHLAAGTNCEPLEAWNKVISYAAKYLGKEVESLTPEGKPNPIGRFWGIWKIERWPVRWMQYAVPPGAWIRTRRTLRRLAERQGMKRDRFMGDVRAQTLFASAALVERLIRFFWPGFGELSWRAIREACGDFLPKEPGMDYAGEIVRELVEVEPGIWR